MNGISAMSAFGEDISTQSSISSRSDLSYDASFKKFFSRKDVLAGILLGVIPEFKYATHQEVMGCIKSSEINPINAELLSSEDVEEPQKIIYDIYLEVSINRRMEEVHLLFDLEMQYSYNLSYPLMNRVIYYVSRLIAKQKITHSDYRSLLPVRSTWISVRGVPQQLKNQVIHFDIVPHDSNGNVIDYDFEGIDLLGFDYILLSEDYDWNEGDETVVKFLQSIFGNNMKDSKFNPYVTVTPEVEKEVSDMSTGFEKMDAELRASVERGIEQGIEQGFEKAIRTYIRKRQELGLSDKQIWEDIKSDFGFSDSDVQRLLGK